MTKIGIIVGSLRKESYNKKLAEMVKEIAKQNFSEKISEIKILEIKDLPIYNQDLEENFPEQASQLKKEIEESEKIIFITPEYNRSIPGILKNAIDWASRPYGKNSFAHKKVLCMGVSGGGLGTVSAQNHLKQILVYLNCIVVGQPEIYIGDYDLENEKTLEVIKKGLQELLK